MKTYLVFEIVTIISSMELGKSPGIDGVTPEKFYSWSLLGFSVAKILCDTNFLDISV